MIDAIDPNGYITGRYYREHCKVDKKGSLVKPMEIITQNKKKLIIIDDSESVDNTYRGKLLNISYTDVENTILVEPWNPGRGRKHDHALQQCIDIVE